jgi:hypothetical protein
MENPEASKRRGWSIIRKAQIIGILVAVLFTVGTQIFYFLNPPQTILDLSVALLLLSALPATLISSKVLGQHVDLLTYGLPKFLAITLTVNLILGFVVGTFIGWLIQKLKTKS